MADVFLLRLQGVLQAWGAHSYEDFRPSLLFPSRSGLAGLLGACLGIRRENRAELRAVADGFTYCARLDRSEFPVVKLLDFHTVQDARKVDGTTNRNPVVSRREYLCDAKFTVAMKLKSPFPYSPDRLAQALRAPAFTPFLGRRSCPLSVPLLDRVLSAESLRAALKKAPPGEGVLYDEESGEGAQCLVVRDVPAGEGRRFKTREVFRHVA